MDSYTASATGIALAAATAKTCLQLVTPSTARAFIDSIEISTDGVTSDAVPILVELVLQTSAGTMSALTPVKLDASAPASVVTAQYNATVEPTTTSVIWRQRISPAGATWYRPFYDAAGATRPRMPVSTRLGLRITAPAIVNVTPLIAYTV
jgi:hypothetical protein